MERFVIIVNDWKLLIIITKRSILDVAAAIDPPLKTHYIIPKDNQFLNAFDRGMDLNKNSFENSFEHFQE